MSCVGPPLCVGRTLISFNKSGYTQDCKDILIINARGMIIKSGINDNNFKRILDGPVDLFSVEFIISRISSLDTSNNKGYLITIFFKFIW